jgi:hypothetical protein
MEGSHNTNCTAKNVPRLLSSMLRNTIGIGLEGSTVADKPPVFQKRLDDAIKELRRFLQKETLCLPGICIRHQDCSTALRICNEA